MRYYIIKSVYEQKQKLHKIKAQNGLRAHKKATDERRGKKFLLIGAISTETLFVGDDELTWIEKFEQLNQSK